MTRYAIKCGCGRPIEPSGSVGRDAFRCGCGWRAQVVERSPAARQCSYGDCRTVAATPEPLRFCVEHEREAASRLGPLAGALEVEAFLNSSMSTRYRRFGDGIKVPPKISRHRPVVYYMERGGLIKIGTTTRLRKRSQELDADVLAAEPGSESEERQRQREFRHLHHHLEWFTPGAELLDHIAKLVKLYGEPKLI
ncbi:hypothetical protein ACH4MO_14020 [Streptomyces globisporus]|uniref:hypothetical protein n=1 Tax=Streptomyces globisporus TaxID=1908 RepID=UPI00379B418B